MADPLVAHAVWQGVLRPVQTITVVIDMTRQIATAGRATMAIMMPEADQTVLARRPQIVAALR
ncbi:MAG: hypothetical protein WA702_14280, partial [Bradyrhizobium sp.]|uniref:hypothetical protein n=1 Tax=Bradyrhizobium sp. TaxID=376 RepID=UPI003C7E92B4